MQVSSLTPVQAPIQAPVQTPVQAPVLAPVQAPVQIPVQAPFHVPSCQASLPAASILPTATNSCMLSLVTLSVTEIGELTSTVPELPEHQLPWLLNILLETTKHCLYA